MTQKISHRSIIQDATGNKNDNLEMKLKRDTINKYIKTHPHQTIYSISNSLNIPMSTVRKLVYELIEFEKVKFEMVTEKGRNKKLLVPLTNPIFKETFDYFLYDNFFNENIGKRELLLANRALTDGISITIEMSNRSTEIIKSKEALNKLLVSNQLTNRP